MTLSLNDALWRFMMLYDALGKTSIKKKQFKLRHCPKGWVGQGFKTTFFFKTEMWTKIGGGWVRNLSVHISRSSFIPKIIIIPLHLESFWSLYCLLWAWLYLTWIVPEQIKPKMFTYTSISIFRAVRSSFLESYFLWKKCPYFYREGGSLEPIILVPN